MSRAKSKVVKKRGAQIVQFPERRYDELYLLEQRAKELTKAYLDATRDNKKNWKEGWQGVVLEQRAATCAALALAGERFADNLRWLLKLPSPNRSDAKATEEYAEVVDDVLYSFSRLTSLSDPALYSGTNRRLHSEVFESEPPRRADVIDLASVRKRSAS